jgi:hypothetical protein
MTLCWTHRPNASRWAILVNLYPVKSRKHTQFHCFKPESLVSGRLQDFITMMWANGRSYLETPANQMQFLWHHLLSSRTHPSHCSLPPLSPTGPLCITHRNSKIGRCTQSHGILGMKALFKQLDQIFFDVKNYDTKFYSFWKFKNWFTWAIIYCSLKFVYNQKIILQKWVESRKKISYFNFFTRCRISMKMK